MGDGYVGGRAAAEVKMRPELRKKYRRNYIVQFLIGDQYEVLREQEENVDAFLEDAFQVLAPRHRDDLIAHYMENKERTAQVAQNIMHGRDALKATLQSQGSIDNLKELCYEKDTSG